MPAALMPTPRETVDLLYGLPGLMGVLGGVPKELVSERGIGHRNELTDSARSSVFLPLTFSQNSRSTAPIASSWRAS